MVSVSGSYAWLDGLPLMRQQLINFTRPLRRQARQAFTDSLMLERGQCLLAGGLQEIEVIFLLDEDRGVLWKL